MKRFVLAVLVAAFLMPVTDAVAQLRLGPGAGATIIMNDTKDETIEDWLAEIEYQFPLDDYGKNWAAITGLYDGDNLGGMLISWYVQTGEVYPGLRAGVFRLSDAPLLLEPTIFAGGEVLLEVNVPGPDESSMPLTAFVGYYGSIRGDSNVSIARLGLRVAPAVFQ